MIRHTKIGHIVKVPEKYQCKESTANEGAKVFAEPLPPKQAVDVTTDYDSRYLNVY